MTFRFAIRVSTILLLVTGRTRPDLAALLSVPPPFLGGIVDTQQAQAGCAYMTVIPMAVVFAVGETISRNGLRPEVPLA